MCIRDSRHMGVDLAGAPHRPVATEVYNFIRAADATWDDIERLRASVKVPVLLDVYKRQHRYCAAEARLGRLRICLLRIAGQNAAAQIAIQTPTRFSLLRAGYDEAFARSSPGNLLTRESIRHAALAGIATYELSLIHI